MSHFKQEQGYGCGLYALSNAFQDNRFFTEENLKSEINGGNIGKLNHYLFEQNEGVYVAYIRYNNENPIELIDLISNADLSKLPYDNYWYPFFVVVKSTEEKNHIICCRLLQNKTVVIHDSLKDNPNIVNNFQELERYFEGKIIYSIEGLFVLSDGGRQSFIKTNFHTPLVYFRRSVYFWGNINKFNTLKHEKIYIAFITIVDCYNFFCTNSD